MYVSSSCTTLAPASRARAKAASTSSTRSLRIWVTAPGLGRPVAVRLGHDDRSVDAGAQLRAVRLADPHPLAEAERLLEPGDGCAHVVVEEHRGDRGGRRGTIRRHASETRG